ncbi:MAG: glutamine amidotransferase [Actinomycetota bacterium]|nr:glutamine amidotransferase [Actinomycetota bacterium]
MTDAVSIVLLYPELLGTYGDGGNAAVLAERLRWRGIRTELVEVTAGEAAPTSGDVYLMGGGEDGPQALAVKELRASGALEAAVDGGAAVLAVCAGYQVLGREFLGPDGRPNAGLGLLDCSTARGKGPRRVGEIVVEPAPILGLPPLTGYENHAGVTSLGAGAQPLGAVVVGHGNDTGDGSEGIVTGHVAGTYLHGPVLARNPALADLLLSWVAGPLDPIDDAEVEDLRAERMRAATPKRRLPFRRAPFSRAPFSRAPFSRANRAGKRRDLHAG